MKKSNLRIYLTFVAVLVVLFFVGFGAGVLVETFQSKEFTDSIAELLRNLYVPLANFVSLILNVLVGITFFRCVGMYKRLQKDMENEELWDKMESALNIPMIFATVNLIYSMILFSGLCYYSLFCDYAKKGPFEKAMVIAGVVLWIATYIISLGAEKLIIDYEKKLNPEKKGNMFDFGFQKQWVNSCDEAQRRMMHRAAYEAMNTMNLAFMVTWILSFLSMFLFQTGLLPIVITAVLWGIMNVTYTTNAAKLESGKKGELK